MEFNGSPTPWANSDGHIYDSEGDVISFLYGFDSDGDLIAAAPELLEALIELTESARESIDGLGDLSDAIDTAKAAIAKALGQQ